MEKWLYSTSVHTDDDDGVSSSYRIVPVW